MEKISYQPRGVCASSIVIEVEEDKVIKVEIIGGCPGNGQGVSRLCEGRSVDEVIDILKGIDCRGRGTSCPDQLATALIKWKVKKGSENVEC